MGFIRNVIRVSIPTGLTYYTVKLGLWSPGAGSREAESRLDCQVNQVKQLTNQISTRLKSIIPGVEVPKMPKYDWKASWNTGVKTMFRWIDEFDAGAMAKKLTSSDEKKIIK